MAQLPANGIVASYSFTGNANDGSGNGNNGVVYNATLTTDRFGHPNSAYSFDGSTSYIEVSGASILNNNDYTYSWWIKVAALPSNGNAASMFEIGTEVSVNPGQTFAINNNYLSTFGYLVNSGNTNSTSTFVNYTSLPSVGTWYNLVITRSDSVKLYVNGVLQAVTSANGTNPYYYSPLDMYIGSRANAFQYFNGIIDDINIYNRVLSQQEIADIVTAVKEESPINNEISIYPNPFKDQINIAFAKPMLNADVKIVNSLGQIVYQQQGVSGHSCTIDFAKELSGFYFVEINQDGTVSQFKIIKN